MTTTTNTERTPGYNCRLQIAFNSDKNGKRVAYYLLRHGSFRWIRMGLAEAESFVAQGQADQINYVKNGR